MKIATLIQTLERKEQEHGNLEIVFMVNGVVHYVECNVVADTEYDEIIIEINEQ